jgi:hypothetical protein
MVLISFLFLSLMKMLIRQVLWEAASYQRQAAGACAVDYSVMTDYQKRA